uniref:Cation/H+ exchanger domain-containing protein n=1 Tax=Romanomermis culicivorax TaxID=13658 RepID=A0A915J565_ROMCU
MTALYVFLLALAYTLILLFGFRKLTLMLFDRFMAKNSNPVSQFLVASVFCCLFISAWITELIGIHAIFGAFLLGLVIPRGNNMAIKLTEKIEDVIIVGFLPLTEVLLLNPRCRRKRVKSLDDDKQEPKISLKTLCLPEIGS